MYTIQKQYTKQNVIEYIKNKSTKDLPMLVFVPTI